MNVSSWTGMLADGTVVWNEKRKQSCGDDKGFNDTVFSVKYINIWKKQTEFPTTHINMYNKIWMYPFVNKWLPIPDS